MTNLSDYHDELHSRDPDRITKALCEIAEGKICLDCGGDGYVEIGGEVNETYDCETCQGTGSIPGDLRAIDALIAATMGEWVKKGNSDYGAFVDGHWESKDFICPCTDDTKPAILNYTTDDAAGGWGLLKGFAFVEITNPECIFWQVRISNPDEDEIIVIHESELVARCLAYLVWWFMTNGE